MVSSSSLVVPVGHILDGMLVWHKTTLVILAYERPQVVEVTMPALRRVFDNRSHQFWLHSQLGIFGVLFTMVYIIPNETCHVSDVCRHIVK